MSKVDELIAALKKEEKKKTNILVWILAIVGAIAAIAGIAYAVYRHNRKPKDRGTHNG